MEEHVHEEFIVVETDTVGYPWAVMVHLKDAAIALRAVMAPIGFCLVTPLADTDTTVAFTLNRWLQAHERLLIRLTLASLLVRQTCRCDKRPLCRLQILEVLMNMLTRLFFALLYQLVCELLAYGSLVLLILLRQLLVALLFFAHHGDRLFTS